MKYYSIWNEPNLRSFFNPQPGYCTSYDQPVFAYLNNLAVPALAAIRAADPTSSLVGPELSGNRDCGHWLDDWLFRLMQYNRNYFDVISVHAYLDSAASVRDEVITPVSLLLGQTGIQGLKPFWLSEFSFSSDPGEVSQAQNIHGVYVTLYDNRWWWWKRSIVWDVQDSPGPPCCPVFNEGLVRPDLSPKQAWWQYQQDARGTTQYPTPSPTCP